MHYDFLELGSKFSYQCIAKLLHMTYLFLKYIETCINQKSKFIFEFPDTFFKLFDSMFSWQSKTKLDGTLQYRPRGSGRHEHAVPADESGLYESTRYYIVTNDERDSLVLL